MPDQVKRILIVRLSAVGDCIHVMPALHALRQALPDAYIAWAVEDRAASVVARHPDLNETIVIPRGEWKRRRLSSIPGTFTDLALTGAGLCSGGVPGMFRGRVLLF